jgi:hypothetical protein
MKRHNDTAERIIKVEGLAFALASLVGKELDTARAMLKDAIVKALRDEFDRGAELQRRSMEGNALIDEIEGLIGHQ